MFWCRIKQLFRWNKTHHHHRFTFDLDREKVGKLVAPSLLTNTYLWKTPRQKWKGRSDKMWLPVCVKSTQTFQTLYLCAFGVQGCFFYRRILNRKRRTEGLKPEAIPALCANQMTNLVRNVQVLIVGVKPRNVTVLQSVWFGSSEVLVLLDVQRAAVCSRQLQLQALWIAGVVQFTAALTGWSFVTVWLWLRLLQLLPFNLTVVLSWLQLSCSLPARRVPGLGGGAVTGRRLRRHSQGATLSGQGAPARFFWRLQTKPLSSFRTVTPVKVRKAGFPGPGWDHGPPLQGAVAKMFKQKTSI